jgi:hypothetical protein
MKYIYKKISFIAVVFSLLASSSVLADGPVVKGTSVLGFGFGPAGTYYGYGGFSPGVKVNFEKGLWEAGPGVITLGGTFGFAYQRYSWPGGYHWTYANYILAARSAWHHGWGVDNLDTYAGLSLGVRLLSYNDGGYNNNANYNPLYLHFGGFIGAAYYFSPKVGAFAEFGYDINFATIGLNFILGGRGE